MMVALKAWMPFFAAAALAVVLLFGVNYCRDRQREQHGAAKQAVEHQQAVVAKQDSIVIRDTVRLRGADRVVTRTVTDYRTLRDTITIRDTVLIAAADTALRACEAYRDTCRQTTADFLQLRLDYMKLDTAYKKLVETPRPRRRWGVGCSAGYGGVVAAGEAKFGPGASCGLAISF